MSATTQTPKAVLKMPSTIGDQIIRADDIKGKLTTNTYFLTGWIAGTVTQTQFDADVTAFSDAETAVNAGTPGAVGLRNTAYKTLKEDLDAVKAMVQAKANTNSSLAVTIIESAGFFVKAAKAITKKQNDALNTEIMGTVLLTADAAGHHEWQMSKDQITITTLPATTTAKTYVHGLTPGDIWYFRNHKVNTKKATYNWSPWVKLLISGGGKTAGGGTLPGHAGSLPTA